MSDELELSLACEAALSEEQKDAILTRLGELNPHWRGAGVADYLSQLWDMDAHLDLTEPAYEWFGQAGVVATLALLYTESTPPQWEAIEHLVEKIKEQSG